MSNGRGGFIGTDGLDAPDPPTGVSASAGETAISISFTAPTDVGTSAITGFVATADDGSGATGTSSPITISSLTNGTAYTARVYAVNAYGTSAASDATSSVTPAAALGFMSVGVDNTRAIDKVTISTLGNGADFGDLFANRNRPGTGASSTRIVFAGGYNNINSNYSSVQRIDYFTASTAGDGADFGDLTTDKLAPNGVCSPTRIVFCGGYGESGGSSIRNVLDYITTASTGNATDFGDRTTAVGGGAPMQSDTRGVYAGGQPNSGTTNVIDYITIASTGNATDFGDTNATDGINAPKQGFSSKVRGVYGIFEDGGGVEVIEFITIATTGNGSDFGDLNYAAGNDGGAMGSNSTRGLFAGGGGGSPVNNISYVTIASAGNAADFGDLTTATRAGMGVSNAHGGLQ